MNYCETRSEKANIFDFINYLEESLQNEERDPDKSSAELLDQFVATKRLEGRSAKTLNQYRFFAIYPSHLEASSGEKVLAVLFWVRLTAFAARLTWFLPQDRIGTCTAP